MVDGLGKTIEARGGSTQRVVDLNVEYAGQKALVARSERDTLIFGRVKSVRDELVRLRVLRPKDDEGSSDSTSS